MSSVSDEYTLSVRNPEIWKFFQANPSLSFESCVLLTVRLMDSVIQSIQSSTDTSESNVLTQLQTKILDSLENIQTNVQTLQTTHSENIRTIKTSYSEDLKQALDSNHYRQSEHTRQLIHDANERLLDKIQIYVNDSIPHNISDQLAGFRNSLHEETSRLLRGQLTSESLAMFIDRFESKTTQLLQTAQQPIYSCLTSTESRIRTDLKSIQTAQQANQSVYENISDFLNRNKYKNSSAKGRYGESRMEEMMNLLYPTAEIVNTTSIPNSGDFFIHGRENALPDILIETKEYTRNVSKEEVDKFIRDVIHQKRHGVMISHTSGIVGKKPFEIEVHQQWIVVFVTSASYEPERLKIATDMIDALTRCLAPYLNNPHPGTHTTISPSVMSLIHAEYIKFVDQKLEMVNHIKTVATEMQRALITQMNLIQFPELSKFIEMKHGPVVRPIPKKPAGCAPQYKPPSLHDKLNGEAVFTCSTPGCDFAGKSNRSLSQHRRKCPPSTPIKK